MHVAEQQLAQLTPFDRTRRYTSQAREPHEATQRLYAVHDEWRAVRDKLPESARPGTKTYDESLVDSLAGAWHYLDQWAIQGEVLFAATPWQNARRSKPQPPCPPYGLDGTAVFEHRRASPPASTTPLRRRKGVHPWAFPAWN
ncbi:hypothetical protein ACIQC7_33085 [Kitasatospora sp. NPDC088556]|uniref:hypothetical protein n=1 Tax=Kitasatospora sp. NPDC088556 TaxID=3364076 RepID=UPI00381139EF